jgi:hypothetical protein
MNLDTFLATIIIVVFLVTIVMAIGSYGAYKLRERRSPATDLDVRAGESRFFERVDAAAFESEKSRRAR